MSPAVLGLLTTATLLGVVVAIAGMLPAPDRAARAPSRLQLAVRAWRGQFSPQRRAIAIGGLVLGIVLFAVSGWPVLLIATPLAAIALPQLLGRGGEAKAIDRLDALETWTRSLAGLTIAGAGLEQTIAASLDSAPTQIRPEVRKLVARLDARWPVQPALQRFADDLADPTADLVVAHLTLAARVRGPGLSNALEDLAQDIFDETRVRRQIETDRSSPRQVVRLVTLITGLLLVLLPLGGTFVAPYRSLTGQLFLTVWLVAYAGLLLWLKRLTLGRPAPRILELPKGGAR